jgi:hypothetical protein
MKRKSQDTVMRVRYNAVEVRTTFHLGANFCYSKIAIKGVLVVVDKVAITKKCASGVMWRTINLWSRPVWLDSFWFREFERNMRQ